MKTWAVFILQGLSGLLHNSSADPKENNAWAALLLSAIYLLATSDHFSPEI